MKARSEPCDPELLRGLTEGRLAAAGLVALEAHLQVCLGCRAALDRIVDHDRLLGPALRSGLRADRSATHGPGPAVDGTLDFLAPSDWPESLGRIATYEVRGVLGRGGMGLVLKAFDPALGRTVAIKVMAAPLAGCGASRRRFLREARAAAAVVHEHVVAVHAVEEAAGLPYIVMEYVPGRSLQERIDRDGPLALPEILRIGTQTAAGLAAAHAQGIVHRDVKPANILLEDGVERVRLVDFGLARAAAEGGVTRSGVVAGTPHYMAPEQARGEATDHRADLFSLGSTLYAACVGHPPFRADSPLAVLRRVIDDEPRRPREANPDLPPWLEGIIARLMAKEPDRRYPTAAGVADLLLRCLAHVQQPMSVPLPHGLGRPGTPRRGLWRRSAALAGAAALAAAAFAAPRRAGPVDVPAEAARRGPTAPAARRDSRPNPGGIDEVDRELGLIRARAEALERDIPGVPAAGNGRSRSSIPTRR